LRPDRLILRILTLGGWRRNGARTLRDCELLICQSITSGIKR